MRQTFSLEVDNKVFKKETSNAVRGLRITTDEGRAINIKIRENGDIHLNIEAFIEDIFVKPNSSNDFDIAFRERK